MAKEIYKITVLNWEKYNGKLKKGHKCILLSTGFLSDAKITSLPIGGRLLYLGLLLRCGEVTSSSIEGSHDLLVSLAGGSGQHVSRLLEQMQELQLLTYAKISAFKDRIEKKIKEKKIKEVATQLEISAGEQGNLTPLSDASQTPKPVSPKTEVSEFNTSLVIGAYCDAWKIRYNSTKSPSVLPHHAKNLKSFVKGTGQQRAIEMIEAYLQMPDSWFLTKRHDIPTFLGNLNAVTQFVETGKVVTRQDIRNVESKVHSHNLRQMIDDGAI